VLSGEETLVACWSALTALSPGAAVVHSSTSVAAIFPAWAPLNNAIAVTPRPTEALAISDVSYLAAGYAAAGVDAWAYWIPSSARSFDASDALVVPGFARDAATLVMAATLTRGFHPREGVTRTSVSSAARAGDAPVPIAELEEPDGVRGLDAWVKVEDGAAVCGAWTFRHGSDCGVYAVGTAPEWRRRGLARQLLEHALGDAVRHGSRTASLQSTAMAEGLYQSMGFVPAGRYEEWVSV
jgi:GNAT superfamily N-acetyltransferase